MRRMRNTRAKGSPSHPVLAQKIDMLEATVLERATGGIITGAGMAAPGR